MSELDAHTDDQVELIVNRVGSTQEDTSGDDQDATDPQVRVRSGLMGQGQAWRSPSDLRPNSARPASTTQHATTGAASCRPSTPVTASPETVHTTTSPPRRRGRHRRTRGRPSVSRSRVATRTCSTPCCPNATPSTPSRRRQSAGPSGRHVRRGVRRPAVGRARCRPLRGGRRPGRHGGQGQ